MKVVMTFLLLVSLFSCSSKKTASRDLASDSSVLTVEEIAEANKQEPIEDIYSEIQKYQVQKYDTLMIIAFKIYGDYHRWREIADLNPSLDEESYSLEVGQVIKFKVPTEAFEWRPRGIPYLIKTGDTLGSISNDVYDTSRRWPEIYENNKPIIPNPNLIFAGFTLFYIPDNDVRSPAQI